MDVVCIIQFSYVLLYPRRTNQTSTQCPEVPPWLNLRRHRSERGMVTTVCPELGPESITLRARSGPLNSLFRVNPSLDRVLSQRFLEIPSPFWTHSGTFSSSFTRETLPLHHLYFPSSDRHDTTSFRDPSDRIKRLCLSKLIGTIKT